MKISDNMLRVINHAYSNSSPAEFLIKTGLERSLNEDSLKIKALEIADMLSKLVKYIDTNSEELFYSYQLPVEAFNKAIAKERSTNQGLVTIKDFIAGNGLAYSEFLEYMYNALAKYEPTIPNLEQLTSSIDRTYTQLTNILSLKSGNTSSFNIGDIHVKLENINLKSIDLKKEITKVKSCVEDISKSIQNVKNNMDSIILDLDFKRLNASVSEETMLDVEEFNKELDSRLKDYMEVLLENQAKAISKSIEDKLEGLNVGEIELKVAVNLQEEIDKVLDVLKDRIEMELPSNRKPLVKGRKLDTIFNSLEKLIKKADNLSEDPNLSGIVDKINHLAASLDGIETNNIAQAGLIGMEIDTIESYLR